MEKRNQVVQSQRRRRPRPRQRACRRSRSENQSGEAEDLQIVRLGLHDGSPLLPAIALETTPGIIPLVPADACVDWHNGEGDISFRIAVPGSILAADDHNFVSP